MKRILSVVLLNIVVLSVFAVPRQIPGSHYVQDYAGVFTPQQKYALDSKLAGAEDSAAIQIAVVTIDSVPMETDINTYATDIFTEWGIGVKGTDNGLLMLFAVKDRQIVMRTGYGTEGVLTDALCSQIIRKKIVPEFKEERYYEGIDAAISDVTEIVKGEFTPSDLGYETDSKWTSKDTMHLFIWLFIIFILPAIVLPKNAKSSYYNFLLSVFNFIILLLLSGGGRGGGGGGRSFGGGSTGGGGASGSW